LLPSSFMLAAEERCQSNILILVKEPVFVVSALAYWSNFILLRYFSVHNHFLKFYFDDVLLVPCALPVILFFVAAFGFRDLRRPPTLSEIITCLIIWSIAFEIVGPAIMAKGTADILDIVAYWFGAGVSWILWNYRNSISVFRSVCRQIWRNGCRRATFHVIQLWLT
jgi:hypothetical protein